MTKRKGPTPRGGRRPAARVDHDTSIVRVVCDDCRLLQRNGRDTVCGCGGLYGMYA